jgi:hypothetical protein
MIARLEHDGVEDDARRHRGHENPCEGAPGPSHQEGQDNISLARARFNGLGGARLAARLFGDDEVMIGSGESFTQLSSPSQ